MLNNDGTTPARPNTFNCCYLAKNAINIVSPNVAPDPPIITNEFWNSPANGILAPCILSCMLDKTIGVKNEVTILAPSIPTIHNAEIMKYITNIPPQLFVNLLTKLNGTAITLNMSVPTAMKAPSINNTINATAWC